MKQASILMFKEKLQKFENFSEANVYFLISSIRISSLLFIFRVCRLSDGRISYSFVVRLCTTIYTHSVIAETEDFVPVDLFKVYLSKMKFISVFCLLSRLEKILSK